MFAWLGSLTHAPIPTLAQLGCAWSWWTSDPYAVWGVGLGGETQPQQCVRSNPVADQLSLHILQEEHWWSVLVVYNRAGSKGCALGQSRGDVGAAEGLWPFGTSAWSQWWRAPAPPQLNEHAAATALGPAAANGNVRDRGGYGGSRRSLQVSAGLCRSLQLWRHPSHSTQPHRGTPQHPHQKHLPYSQLITIPGLGGNGGAETEIRTDNSFQVKSKRRQAVSQKGELQAEPNTSYAPHPWSNSNATSTNEISDTATSGRRSRRAPQYIKRKSSHATRLASLQYMFFFFSVPV